MTELFVIIACSTGQGCAETLNQYREVNPQIKEIIYNAEDMTRKTIPPFIIQYYGPLVAYMVGMEGNVTLTKHISLKVSDKKQSVNFALNF